MSDRELERELKKMSKKLEDLADSWATTGLPDTLEEVTIEVEKFIEWLETHRPDIKKKRQELLRRFPGLKDLEVSG